MKNLLITILIWTATAVLVSAQSLTLEDIFQELKYDPTELEVVGWLDEGKYLLYAIKGPSGNRLIKHNIASGVEEVLFDYSILTDLGLQGPFRFEDFALSPDERYMLIPSENYKVWRRSTVAQYHIYNLKTGKLRKLTSSDTHQSCAQFSPDGSKIAYVIEGNICTYNLKRNRTLQLTEDGSSLISNGQADWLYEEEFAITRMFEWSPDSRSLLFLRFDQTDVPIYVLTDEMAQYQTITAIRYPKVGAPNASLKLGVVPVGYGTVKWLDIDPGYDHYIPRIYWTGKTEQAACYILDRRQQRLDLVLINTKNGYTKIAASQTDPAWVETTDDLHFLDAGRRFIWTDESSGYRHIYLRDSDGDQIQALTEGDWEVTEIEAVDAASGWVYFTGKKDGSTQQQAYRVDLAGSEIQSLSNDGGWNSLQAATGVPYHVLGRSTVQRPEQFSLHSTDGERIRGLADSPAEALAAQDLPVWEFFTLPTEDGAELNAMILKPHDFDSAKPYPTMIYTYGGPGSQMVRDKWYGSRGLWHYYLAQEGYVVLVVDNRGTGGRGKTFANLAYGDIGKWALHDQIEAAKWVGRQSWGDSGRIGIWGWSGGGYLTCLAMMSGAEYFKMGISVSPVTDLRLYDTAWTERYMGLHADNEAGYISADVLSHVAGYRGGLLLVHGTGDDNVHPQHSWQLINLLSNSPYPFQWTMYPGQNHSLPGVRYDLYQKMIAFVRENL